MRVDLLLIVALRAISVNTTVLPAPVGMTRSEERRPWPRDQRRSATACN